jgi:hypothetical protein
MANSVNILLGVGLLSVPYALQQGGWAGLGVLGILGVTTNYTGKILIRCQRRGSLPAIGDHQTRCDVNDSGGTGAVRLFEFSYGQVRVRMTESCVLFNSYRCREVSMRARMIRALSRCRATGTIRTRRRGARCCRTRTWARRRSGTLAGGSSHHVGTVHRARRHVRSVLHPGGQFLLSLSFLSFLSYGQLD